jgi:hypothetical protein
MHQKLDLLGEQRSAGVGLSDKKPIAHSALVAAQQDELLATGMGHCTYQTIHLKVGKLHWELGIVVLKL